VSAHAHRHDELDFKPIRWCRRYVCLIDRSPRVWCHAFKEDSMKPVERTTNRATTRSDDGLSIFLSVRPRLFGIAYRMLGSAADAEDIVQDVWVRWQTTDRSVVRDVAAFLAAITTRLAINVMQSARSRRETYVGPWLPERVDTSADPGVGAERGEALESGVLILLEKLSPAERAAYILREAFDYAYRDIADTLRLQEANARQLVSRARQHVTNGRRRASNATEQRRLLAAFVVAAKDGDVAGLEGLVASDVVSTRNRGLLSRFTYSRRADTSQHISVSGQWPVEALGEAVGIG
jgi:RNA polymerase sigma-70 factor (ECF subfamily)